MRHGRANGQRLRTARTEDNTAANELRVVLNWVEVLKQQLGGSQ
jgi:hypothetical protein